MGPFLETFMVKVQNKQKEVLMLLFFFRELRKNKNYYQHKNFLGGLHDFSVPEPGI